MSVSIRQTRPMLLALFIVASLTAIGIFDLYQDPPFHPHIKTFIKDFELPIVIAVFGLMFYLAYAKRYLLLSLTAIAMIAVHLAGLVLLMPFLRMVSIYILSRLFQRVVPSLRSSLIPTLLIGFALSLLLYAALSVVSLYTWQITLGLDCLIILIGLYGLRGHLKSDFMALRENDLAVSVSLIVYLLLVFRGAAPLSYDPSWYTFEWMNRLSSPSIWSVDHYVNMVHHYGKGMEMLSGYLTGLGNPRYIAAFGAMFPALLIFEVMRGYSVKREAPLHLAAILLIGAILMPAVSGIAASGKVDSFGLFALMAIILLLRDKSSEAPGGKIAVFMIGLAVCLMSKPIFFVWGAVTFIVFAPKVLTLIRANKSLLKPALISALIGALALFCVWMRTYLNTGYAFVAPSVLMELQRAVGLSPNNGFTNVELNILEGPDRLYWERLWQLFAAPSGKGHYGDMWPGVFFAAIILPLATGLKRRPVRLSAYLRLMIVGAAILYIIIGLQYPRGFPDGTYVAFPFLAIIVLAFDLDFSRYVIPGRKLGFILLLGVTLFSSIMLVTVDWYYGLGDYPQTSPSQQRSRILEKAGLSDVANMLSASNPRTCRVFVVYNTNVHLRPIMNLPCRTEKMNSIAWDGVLRTAVKSGKNERLTPYYEWSDTAFILIEKNAAWDMDTDPNDWKIILKTYDWVLYSR